MIPINKINDPEKVLPQKVGYYYSKLGYPDNCMYAHNNAIDKYDSLSIDGDVEKLEDIVRKAKLNHECCESCLSDSEYGYDDMPDCCCKLGQDITKEIIANLDKFLVVRKG